MSAESAHLTDREKLDLARAVVEHGPTVDHLRRCPQCAEEVERLHDAEEECVCATASEEAPAQWFRDAGADALKEMDTLLKSTSASDRRISGKWTIPPANDPTKAKTTRTSPHRIRRSWPVIAGLVSAAVVAASAILLVRPNHETIPRVRERGEGVSATLFCSARPNVELGSNDWCPAGAEIGVVANSAADSRLRFLTVVECTDGFPCVSASRSPFEGPSALTAAGPLIKPGSRLELIVIWSDREVSDEFLAQATKTLNRSSGVPSLSLPSSWGQNGFTVQVAEGRSPR